MHAEAFGWIREQVELLGWVDAVVEIGGRDVNGSVRPLFACGAYISLDIEPGPGVDLIADGATWEAKQPVDAVVCCEVLEHTPLGAELVANAARNLRTNGILLLTAATAPRSPHSGVDGGPLRMGEHYRNITRADLVQWLGNAGFIDWRIETHPDRGDIYAIATKAEV